MEGRSVPAVLAVSLGRREVGSLDAGAKRKRAERSDAAAGGSNSTSAEEEASLKRRGEERPRSVTEAGTKSRWEKAEKGINGDDAPVAVGRQGRLRLHPPSAHPVQRLVNACRALLRCSGAAPPPAVVAFIGRMLNGIGPEDVALRQEVRFFNKMNCAGRQNPPIITCKTLFQCDSFTVAVFFLPAATAMPLHDHPGMTVLSKLLIGSAHVKSYDWIYPYIFVGLDSGDHRCSALAKKVVDRELTAAASAPWVLYPTAGGNMHRFFAGEEGPCAFLDVLTPPYSSPRRECTFYQDFPYYQDQLHPNVFGGNVSEEQRRRLAWLLKIGTPEDLRITNLPYRGPAIL